MLAARRTPLARARLDEGTRGADSICIIDTARVFDLQAVAATFTT